MHGWLIIDKPEGISSAGIVNKLKRFTNKNKIGHTGTLDPFASGLLVIAVGHATKLSDHVMQHDKSYTFTICWGSDTDTLDYTGQTIKSSNRTPSLKEIKACINLFPSNTFISQIPPKYSALHVDGKRAYALARSGVEFSLSARNVLLNSIQILKHSDKTTDFMVHCGKGFYVRSMARDIAKHLGVCGHILTLRRTSVGKIHQTNAIKLDYLLQLLHNASGSNTLDEFLIPVNALLDDILVLRLGDEHIAKLICGQKVRLECSDVIERDVIVCDLSGNSVIAMCRATGSELIPRRVINNKYFEE